MSIYREFGLEPIINASGSVTRLGGSPALYSRSDPGLRIRGGWTMAWDSLLKKASIGILVVCMVALPQPLLADLWYEHYAAGEKALAEERWADAIDEINSALEKKGDSGSIACRSVSQ